MSSKKLQLWAAYATIGAFIVGLIAYVFPRSATEGGDQYPAQTAQSAVQIQTPPAPAAKQQPVASPVRRTFELRETNTRHKPFDTNTQTYSRIFRADEGYVIDTYEWQEESATRVSDFVINLVEGGRALQIDFKLKSGPKVDRYRGWLKGKLVTNQIPSNGA